MFSIVLLIILILLSVYRGYHLIFTHQQNNPDYKANIFFQICCFTLGFLGIFYSISSDELARYENKFCAPWHALQEPEVPEFNLSKLIDNQTVKTNHFIIAIDRSQSVPNHVSKETGVVKPNWFDEALESLKRYNFRKTDHGINESVLIDPFRLNVIKAALTLEQLSSNSDDSYEIISFSEGAINLSNFEQKPCAQKNVREGIDSLLALIHHRNKNNLADSDLETDFIDLFKFIFNRLEEVNINEKEVTLLLFSDLIHSENHKTLPNTLDTEVKKKYSHYDITKGNNPDEWKKCQEIIFNERNRSLKEKINKLSEKEIITNLILLSETSEQFDGEDFEQNILPWLIDAFPKHSLNNTYLLSDSDSDLLYKNIDSKKPIYFNYSNSFWKESSLKIILEKTGDYSFGLIEGHSFPKNSIEYFITTGDERKSLGKLPDNELTKWENFNANDVLEFKYEGYPITESTLPKLKIKFTTGDERNICILPIAFYKKLSTLNAWSMLLLLIYGFLTLFLTIIFSFLGIDKFRNLFGLPKKKVGS